MVLVTGGTGFLGAYIIKHLVLKGHRVRAIRRENSVLPFFISKEIMTMRTMPISLHHLIFEL